MKTSNKLYCIQRSSYRFRITKNKQVNTCFFIETDYAHLPLAGKTESTILEQHTYTSFEIEQACSIFWNTLYTYLFRISTRLFYFSEHPIHIPILN